VGHHESSKAAGRNTLAPSGLWVAYPLFFLKGGRFSIPFLLSIFGIPFQFHNFTNSPGAGGPDIGD